MPIDYHVLEALGVVYARLRGACTAEEIIAFRRRVREEPRYAADIAVLVDTRELSAPVAEGDLQRVAAALRDDGVRETGRRAVVTHGSLASDPPAKFAAYLPGDGAFRAFGDVPGAIAWLKSRDDAAG